MHLDKRLPVWFHALLSVEGIIPPAGESLADWMQCVTLITLLDTGDDPPWEAPAELSLFRSQTLAR